MLGTKIIPIGAIRARSWASCPAPLGISFVVKPKSVAASWIMLRNLGSVGAGTAVTSSATKEIVVPVSAAIFFADSFTFSNTRSIFDFSRSRISRLITTLPGMTLGAPGSAWIFPTVATCRPGMLCAIWLTDSTNFAAATSASFLCFMGVVPAWLANPSTVTSHTLIPTIPSTTPMLSFSASKIPPCSMCNSR